MMLFWWGIVTGGFVMFLISQFEIHSYKRILKMKGDSSCDKSEKILGEWYRIEKESR